MVSITSLRARAERLSLRQPFVTAMRRAEFSDTVFVEIQTDTNVTGLGAATPVRYVTGETVDSVLSAVVGAAEVIVGRSLLDIRALSSDLADALPQAASARAGIEIALVDALGKIGRVPSFEALGGAPIAAETDITIPIVEPERAGLLAADAARQGFRLFKVKVGGRDPADDLASLFAITEAVPNCSLIVDANQAFRPSEAIAFIHRLADKGAPIAIFEQPVDRSDTEGLAEVTRSAPVPVFADEAAATPQDVAALTDARAAAGVNVKLMKSGFFGALEIVDICRAKGLKLMLGCMLEPRIGIAAALHLACIACSFDYFDLDADLLLARDGLGGFIRDGSTIRPVRAPGLGCPSGS